VSDQKTANLTTKQAVESTQNNHSGRFSLGAKERLKSAKSIEYLFSDGKAISAYPLRLVFIGNSNGADPMRCAFSVSKRHFKKAVDRNRIKRLLRTSYRKIKPTLYQKLPHPYMGMILFNGKEVPSQKNTDKSMEILLEKWLKSLSL
jgi:ribonuclease P protein component|tara:strand:- start:318 stop:758 length:441 start_codon:yes stop_codon:yes gene_type:complete